MAKGTRVTGHVYQKRYRLAGWLSLDACFRYLLYPFPLSIRGIGINSIAKRFRTPETPPRIG